LVALGALYLDDFADVRKREVECRLPKLMDELAGVCFAARAGCQFVVDCEAHAVSLASIVQHPGLSVTHELPPTFQS